MQACGLTQAFYGQNTSGVARNWSLGANQHFCLKISLYIVLMYKKFKNSNISSA
jgi:hypothetical protein